MSGALPTNVGFKTLGLKSMHRTLRSESQSGIRQVRKIGAHKWLFTAEYPPMSREEFMPIYAFLVSQQGKYGSFTVIPTDLATPQGTATGTPTVSGGAHVAGDTAVIIDGFTPNITGILKAGDIMKFANHDKVYMVISDANTSAGAGDLLLEGGTYDGDRLLLDQESDGSYLLLENDGATTISIEPPLVVALSDNESVTVINVPFTVEMKTDVQAYNVSVPIIYSFELDLMEVLGG